MILLLIMAGAAILSISPVSAVDGITIAARGDQSYYLGEEVGLSGSNYDSDFTYLFIVGPDISGSGGKLTSPHQNVVSGSPDSFDRVKTKSDKTWEYIFYTDNLGINPGPYTIYAVSQPKTKDQLNGVKFNNVSIILKKEFISAEISPSTVPEGKPFTINGHAEGDPGAVQIWIMGDNYLFDTTIPVNPDSSFTFNAGTQISGKLPKGQYYLIVQHPMQNNQLDVVVGGDWVTNLQLKNGNSTGGMNIFRISGAGSLQGRDAVQAFVAAFGDPAVDDTYSEIPFFVDDTRISDPLAQPVTTTPVQSRTQPSPLQYPPIGAVVLIGGIFVWRRQ
jgi:hypothetical protein